MVLEYIDAGTLKVLFLAGVKGLESKKEWINELNVFPVPDGDTGTNMMLTVQNAVSELSKLPGDATVTDIVKTISTGTLRGARGNSGVILSQLCRGFSKEIEGAQARTIDKELIAAAFERAVTTAYKAVMQPKEGTILTVAKAASVKARELAKEDISMEQFFASINRYAEYILGKTPDMLPVLKEAGVVDSGGQGLVEFLKGAYDAYVNDVTEVDFSVLSAEEKEMEVVKKRIDTSNIETSDIKFGYCTEFIINLEKDFDEKEEYDFKSFLASIGDSIVCVNMDDLVKVHVHSNHPGEVIERALTYGSLSSLKIDNMREEHNTKLMKESEMAEAFDTVAPNDNATEEFLAVPRKEWGFVAVCAGDGMAKIFQGMSVDEIIEGGQTMNPSTEDIVAAVNKVNAENVFVLPNNSNIIMAATQACYLVKDKKVIVIPTKTVTQGITAVINYVPALSIDDNTQVMTDAAKEIKTAEITYSIRDTEIEGKRVHSGDYMGIGDGHMLAVGTDRKQTTVDAVMAMIDEDSELLTIYYGADATEEEASEIEALLEAEDALADIDIEVVYGGQPVYYYIVSLE
ncbi:MAG: DAK2 domain-containing protein [Lachnospiraceae bacterium]|nr:DAK2 domain-containing protein [Lachnospiraceae bacterium]